MSLNRKRKKELRNLQNQANRLWESQQVLVEEAGNVAREASRQLGNYGREQVVPQVQATYDKGVATSKHILNDKIVPAAGAVVGSAMSVWDAANDTRERLAAGRGLGQVDWSEFAKRADKYGKAASQSLARKVAVVEAPPKRGIGAGGVIAIILGAAAALGVLYAAWQTLRADDELWVADDPLRAPDA